MFGIPWKLIGIGVAALILVYGAVRIGQAIGNTIERANKYDETQKKYDELTTNYRQTVDRFTKAAADDLETGRQLAALNSKFDAQEKSFDDYVRSHPLTKDVKHVDPQTGVTNTCRERDPAVYRVRYNAGVDGVDPGGTAPAVVP